MADSDGVISDDSSHAVVSDDRAIAERALAEYELSPNSALTY